MDKTDVLMELSAYGRNDLCKWAADNLKEKFDDSEFIEARRLCIAAIQKIVDLETEISTLLETQDAMSACLKLVDDFMRRAEPRSEAEDVDAFIFARSKIRSVLKHASSHAPKETPSDDSGKTPSTTVADGQRDRP